MPSLDIITSAYNEEECLPELFRRISDVMTAESNYEYRLIVIDNGSIDQTWDLICNESEKNIKVVGIRMSRNFSLDSAFTCGLDYATADVAIIMTSDLQDPPEAIPQLLRKFEEGYDQVLAKILKRESVPLLRRILSKIFYKLANAMTSGMLPESVSDFRLVNKRTYAAIRRLRESHRFLRGIGAWVGFKTSQIEIERPPRFAGESKWLGMSFFRVVGVASKSILAYSAQPLAWVSFLGLSMSVLSIFSLFLLIIFWVVFGVPFAGFGSLIGVMVLGFSLTMFAIGILAQYLGLIYEEVKQRPLYLVTETSRQLEIH
jgi:glycosyltransferase involved in cell wall biosynthesis